ncbi:MAG: hypothetical protein U5K33_10320 [Halofilum sp. (in: g-proteobacteria)]|nr:hypothetical protein [Halofilum sp. (in: g-proteobacteria)]
MPIPRLRSHERLPSGDAWPISLRDWRRWMETAQRLEQRELAHRMLEIASTLNQRPMSPRQRVRTLELLQPCIRRALDYLATRFQAQPLPLPSSARASYRIMLELLSELAAAFETAVFAPAWPSPRRTLALAGERALSFLGERNLRIAQTYAAPETDYWSRVNRLYRALEAAGASDRPVAGARIPGAAGSRRSPAAMYKQLLLFALAGLQGMRRDEAARLYRALDSWASLARLQTPDATGDRGLQRFAVDLDSDLGPGPAEQAGSGPGVRTLEVSELIIHIEQLREQCSLQSKAVPALDEVGQATLARLLDSWMPGSYQRSRRARRGSQVDAEVCLEVIHARLSADGAAPDEANGADNPEPPPDWELEPIADSDMALSRDKGGIRAGVNWNEIPQTQQPSPGFHEARAAASAALAAGAEQPPPRWILEDVSATGFRLIWEGAGACHVAVGELVALRTNRRDGDRSRWCIGVVRRMRFLDEHRFEIGVQAVAPTALAVELNKLAANPNLRQSSSDGQHGSALLLPADRRDRTPTTLLVPSHAWREGDRVELHMRKRCHRFTLGSLVEDTGTVSRYRLEPAPDRRRQTPSDARFAGSA